MEDVFSVPFVLSWFTDNERILGGRKDSVFIRCGSRINTDRFPNRLRKAQTFKGKGHAPPEGI